MSLVIGDLVGMLRADDSGMRRGLNDAELRMRGFTRDVEGRLRHLDGRFATVGEQIAAGLREGSDEGRGFNLELGRIVGAAGGLLGVAGSVGRIAAMLGTAVPLAAGLAATVGNIAPAAGVAVTGMVALQLATNTVKLGMIGVKEAVAAAMDPSDPEAYAEALKKLSPEARAFAEQVRTMQPDLKALQQAVQDKMFQDWSASLREAAVEVLPVLRNGLNNTAISVNRMGHGVFSAAQELAENGTLGRAISSANIGLSNLTRAPGQLVTGLGQIAAAAGPAFERLTSGAGAALDTLSQKMTEAFESGTMERAIEQAIDVFGQLLTIAGNVLDIVGSIFGAAQVSGGGFLGVLEEITGALAEAFASPEVQGGLRAIFDTMAQLARTVAPLLIDVLKIIGPIFEELGPPIQTLIKALGDALAPVIKALGPVLKAAAKAVGKLIEAFAPILPVIGELVAALLPALTPLFDALAVVFEALAPVVKTVADILVRTLTPIIAALTPIIEPLAKLLADQLVFWLGFLGDLLIELAPSFEKIGIAFADLMVACAPLIEELAALGVQLLEKIAPYLPEIIDLVGQLAGFLAWVLASNISNILIPALEIVADLLSGDFSGALDKAKKLAIDMVSGVIRNFKEMPGKVWSALSDFGSKIKTRATEAGLALTRTVTQKVGEAVDWIKGLPGRAMDALGDISYTLFLAGWNLVGGFIEGILARVPNLKDNLNWITSMLTSWKGPESVDAKILTPAGEQVMGGFMRGISSQIPALRSQLQGLTGELPGMAIAGAGAAGGGRGTPVVRIELSGPDEVKRLIRKIVLDDGGGNVQRALGW